MAQTSLPPHPFEFNDTCVCQHPLSYCLPSVCECTQKRKQPPKPRTGVHTGVVLSVHHSYIRGAMLHVDVHRAQLLDMLSTRTLDVRFLHQKTYRLVPRRSVSLVSYASDFETGIVDKGFQS